MSTWRLGTTTALLAAVALVLDALTPTIPAMVEALASAQRTADVQGPDAVVVAAAGLVAWAAWAWGALGLALTAGSALPGLAGAVARVAVHGVLPAGARRGAALALGVGLGVAAPVLGTTLLPVPASAAVPATEVPDWPAAPAGPSAPVPDWPSAVPGASALPDWPEAGARDHVVVRGDCLWHIAADRWREEHDRPATDAETAAAVQAWWTANADVIGPDPDLLLPGQVLDPPAAP